MSVVCVLRGPISAATALGRDGNPLMAMREVRAFALQALADLAAQRSSIRPGVIEILRRAARNGTPAMKARSRRLLLELEHARTKT